MRAAGRMKWPRLAVLLLALLSLEAHAHDTFLKFEDYFLSPASEATVLLINGTFTTSENNVALERFQDARITGPGDVHHQPKDDQWQLTDTLNELTFMTGTPGTYLIGASIKPRVYEQTAEAFNGYLEHDGVLDTLEARRSSGELDQPVAEKYAKHVKALFQVGDQRTDNFDDVYGYPVEIVPKVNPYTLSVGETLPVLVLSDGQPLGDQLVYASHADFKTVDESGQPMEAISTRTDAWGLAHINLSSKGRWYVRLIHMVRSGEVGLDYESNWATLTFEVR